MGAPEEGPVKKNDTAGAWLSPIAVVDGPV